MVEKLDTDGRVQVSIRLLPEEARQLDALQTVLDRDSRANMARVLIKERMRQLMADPEMAAKVNAELSVKALA